MFFKYNVNKEIKTQFRGKKDMAHGNIIDLSENITETKIFI